MNLAAFSASGTVTLNNSGVYVTGQLATPVMGFRMGFSGAVDVHGYFSFTANTGLTFGPISASLTLTLAHTPTYTGFSAHVHAGLDVTARISFLFFSLTVGFRGSFDVGFTIQTDGSFHAAGSFQMCGYLGVTVCVGLGFSIDNHQFCIRTSQIGFSLWGVSFHPFADLCFGY
jgi:hypothetical protein